MTPHKPHIEPNNEFITLSLDNIEGTQNIAQHAPHDDPIILNHSNQQENIGAVGPTDPKLVII